MKTMEQLPPPHSLDAERSALGSVLIRPAIMDELTAIVTPGDFFLPAHVELYGAMVAIHAAGGTLDAITLWDALGSAQARLDDGLGYLVQLANETPTAENGGHYARIVRDKAILRRTIAVCSLAMSRAYGGADAAEVLSELRVSVAQLEQVDDSGPVRVGDVIEACLDVVEKRGTEPSKFAVVTHMHTFDSKIGGLKPGQNIIVAARPGIGKTALALTTAIRAAGISSVPILVFSLEMKRQELLERALAFSSGVPGYDIGLGRLSQADWTLLNAGRDWLKPIPLWLDDRKLTIGRLCSEARRWRARYAPTGQAMVVVDYLGLVRSDERSQNRAIEVGEIARALKLLAGDLDLPTVVVAQLNRESVKGTIDGKPRKPIMSDLRDSGEIEQHADMIIFPWREQGDGGASTARTPASLIVAKHRGGPTGEIDVEWDGALMAFYDLPVAKARSAGIPVVEVKP